MKIFLSYASEDRPQAEEIQLALAGAGHEVFFDRESLPAGGDYHTRIKASVDAADLFVFLISPDSVARVAMRSPKWVTRVRAGRIRRGMSFRCCSGPRPSRRFRPT